MYNVVHCECRTDTAQYSILQNSIDLAAGIFIPKLGFPQLNFPVVYILITISLATITEKDEIQLFIISRK